MFFRDGTLVYQRENNDQRPAYVRLDLATGARESLAPAYGGGPASPTPDGRGLVFQRLNFIPLGWRIAGGAHTSWNDLYHVELASGSVRPLTRGFRAHEPDVSPDGTQVACVVGGEKHAPARDRADRRRCPARAGARRARLRLHARVFAGWAASSPTHAGSRAATATSTSTTSAARTDRALTVDRAMDVDPRFTPDGRYLLWSSDRTGIYDVYAYELATAQLYQVTNVLSGAFQPIVSLDGSQLVYTGFNIEGFDLYAMPFDPQAFRLAQPFANARVDAAATPDADDDSPDSVVGTPRPPMITRTTSYKPWKYMYPRTWELRFYSEALGLGAAAFISTTIADPVGNHSVGANLLLPLDGDPSVRGRLLLPAAVPVVRRRLSSHRPARARPDHRRRQHVLPAARAERQRRDARDRTCRRPLLRASSRSATTTPRTGPPIPCLSRIRPGGIIVRPEIGPDANLYLWWYFSNVHSWRYSISGQEGRLVRFNLRFSDPVLGGRFHTTELTASWQEYLTPPWARLHALALLWSGGIGIGDKRDFFALGGFQEQDVLRAIFLNRPQCCIFLRGYPPGSLRRRQLPDRVRRVPRAAAPHRARLPDLPGLPPAGVGRGLRRRRQCLPGRASSRRS